MSYMSAKARVEQTLPSQFFLHALLNGVEDSEMRSATAKLLLAHTEAQVAGMLATERSAILRRSKRVFDGVVADYSEEGDSPAKFGLIVFHFIRHLIDVGYWEFAEDGPLLSAAEAILPALQDLADVAEVDRSAEKQSRRLIKKLHAYGLFLDIHISG